MSLNHQSDSIKAFSNFLEETSLNDKPTGLQLEAFKPELFRKNVEVAISKLEKYLADDSIRGIELTNPHELLAQAS